MLLAAPITTYPNPAASAGDPMARCPHEAWARREHIDARDPDIANAGPLPIAGAPDIAWRGRPRHGLDDRGRWRDANHHGHPCQCRCRRQHQCRRSKQQRKLQPFHSEFHFRAREPRAVPQRYARRSPIPRALTRFTAGICLLTRTKGRTLRMRLTISAPDRVHAPFAAPRPPQ